MQLRVTPTPQASAVPVTPSAAPPVPVSGLSPEQVPVLTADRLNLEETPQGQSPPNMAFAEDPPEPPPIDWRQVQARPVDKVEIEQVLAHYQKHVQARLQAAPPDSPAQAFETSVRLMAQLRDPKLKEDLQAWDTLRMRKSQIEVQYAELVRSPEVQAHFEAARQSALQDIFGENKSLRAHQQAAYLLSDGFQNELNATETEAIQERVQQELSALSILNPRLAEAISEDLLEKTLRFQSLRLLQASDEAGDQARHQLGNALEIYVKAHQSAARVGMQANNLALLANLSDDKITQLTQAVASLTQGVQASNNQQLAQALLSRVEQLPPDLQANAQALLTRMQAQNILGTVILAGSVSALLQQDLPQDPETWASLTAASLTTASTSHFALRLAGLPKTADLASKINYTAELGALKLPILFSVAIGINTTLDAVALTREIKNEDPIGAASRAVSVGSGLASLAAITVLSGPAAPITVIGATVAGLAAWGIDYAYGESDLTGQIRQDLRELQILDREQKLQERFAHSNLATLPLQTRVQVIHGLLDDITPHSQEQRISTALMATSDAEFMPLMKSLHNGRLANEIEDPALLAPITQRLIHTMKPQAEDLKVLENILFRLCDDGRFDEAQKLWRQVPQELKPHYSSEGLRLISRSVQDRWLSSHQGNALLSEILSDPQMQAQALSVLSRREGQHYQELRHHLPEAQNAQILAQLFQNHQPEAQGFLNHLFTGVPAKARQPARATQLGQNPQAAHLCSLALSHLNAAQLKAMAPQLKQSLLALLETQILRGTGDADVQKQYQRLKQNS